MLGFPHLLFLLDEYGQPFEQGLDVTPVQLLCLERNESVQLCLSHSALSKRGKEIQNSVHKAHESCGQAEERFF